MATISALRAVRGDTQSRQAISQIFLDVTDRALEDDHFPCPFVVHSSLSALSIRYCNYIPGELATPLAKDYPDVLITCARWLMRPRTTDQRRTLATSSSYCSCVQDTHLMRELHDPGSFFMHPLGVTVEEQPFKIVMDAQTRILASMMNHTPDGAMWKIIKHAIDAPQAWPRGLDDLAPYGIPQSIQNLCAWSEFYDRPELLMLACALYTHTADPAFPSAVVVSIIPYTLLPTMDTLLSEIETATTPVTLEKCLTELKHAARVVRATADTEDHVLRRLIGYDAASGADWASFIRLCMGVYRAMRALDKSQRHLDVGDIKRAFLSAATRFHVLLGFPQNDTGHGPEVLNALHFWRAKRDGFDALKRFGERLYRGHICAHRACERTPLSKGRSLYRCGADPSAIFTGKTRGGEVELIGDLATTRASREPLIKLRMQRLARGTNK